MRESVLEEVGYRPEMRLGLEQAEVAVVGDGDSLSDKQLCFQVGPMSIKTPGRVMPPVSQQWIVSTQTHADPGPTRLSNHKQD